MDGPLGRLALGRGPLDRQAHLRRDADLITSRQADPATLVVSLVGARVEVIDRAGPRLLLRPASEVVVTEDQLWVYLGRDVAGTEYLAVADPLPDDERLTAATRTGTPDEDAVGPGGGRLAGLREIGSVLDDTAAGLVTAAIALSNWHATHTRCPRCGSPTEPEQGGWVRRCVQDGTEHYPRTDPAVIVAVTDAVDRLLLGRHPSWPENRFSTLAGFVEPGESLEDAVRREVFEESGVTVGEVTYLGSQPWPFPASLMVGCSGVAVDPTITVDGDEIGEARWFSRADLLADCRSGRLLIPPGVSISRRLVEHWYGEPLPTEGTWR